MKVSSQLKKLNCTCLKRHINTKWHWLDGSNITNEEVEEIVQEDFKNNVEGNITVDKSSLIRVIQKKMSVRDDRPAALSIGWTAMLFVAIPVTLIVAIDVIDMINYLHTRN